MANCVGFLEHAAANCGIDVGFGKMFPLYADATPVAIADLTATAINTAIKAGTIKGLIKGWHTVTGAPVAETNVERPGSAEMKLIRSEILADTLMFENSLVNNEIISDLVKAGTLYGILIDDMGNVYGEQSAKAGYVIPMRLNFSGKTTTSFQKDNTSDKSVSVTVRYLVKEVQAVVAGVEVEDIVGKTLLVGQLVSNALAPSGIIILLLKDKSTNGLFDGNILSADINITGGFFPLATAVYDPLTGELIITSSVAVDAGVYQIAISGDTFYMKETQFILTGNSH